MIKHIRTLQVMMICFISLFVSVSVTKAQEHSVLYGFTAFPHDITSEAMDKVHEIILPNSNLYAIHRDGCLPWAEALDNKPFPEWLQSDWQDIKGRIPATHTIYVAVTPTAIDRHNLALACGETEEGEKPPPFSGVSFNHPDVIKAYVNYVRRVVAFFQPRYLNIGIEISELSLGHPDEWQPFESLFMQTYTAIKAESPQLQIGAEFVLQSLLLPRVAQQVKPVVEKSDYVGLSFYPYGSDYGVKIGAPPLPEGVDQWMKPLDWVRQYTNKPLAICETGYLTQPLQLQDPPLQFPGSDSLQTAFLSDLVKIVKRDHYLFAVWFISIDYDRLYEKLPPGVEWKKIWMHTGLFDKDLQPKPAWALWQQFAQNAPGSVQHQGPAGLQAKLLETSSLTANAETQLQDSAKSQIQLGFTRAEDVFRCFPGRADLDESVRKDASVSMRWRFTYTSDWAWCSREVPKGHLATVKGMRFWVKSDREGAIGVRLDEADGESFFALVSVGQDWRPEVQALANFTHDGVSAGNGRLEPEKVTKVMMVDGGGMEDGARGERTLWLADFMFE